MSRTLLLTGATGAVGVPLLAALLRAAIFDRVIATVRAAPESLHATLRREAPDLDLTALSCLTVDLGRPDAAQTLAAIDCPVDCVVHAAACTRFRAPLAQLTQANVEGTRQILTWAASRARAPRIVQVSTTCVAGERTGEIDETPQWEDRGFVNHYERTKWQAEQLVLASPLRPEIVRLATVIGRERDGRLARPGAFHTALRWLHRGLLPILPGDDATRLDLLPTELVTGFLLRLLSQPAECGGIYHVSCGLRGVPLRELLAFATERFAECSSAWRSGQILPPVLAPRAAFEDFHRTVRKSRDFLFNQVLDSVDSFLPELFYPKRYATTHAEAVWGGSLPLPHWRHFLGRVIDRAVEDHFGRSEIAAAAPA
jgi:nucleoside-diphosphate-sugar epimerase